jgi:hypothetical protein
LQTKKKPASTSRPAKRTTSKKATSRTTSARKPSAVGKK